MVEIKTIENNAKNIDVQINNKISDFIDKNFKKDLNYFEKKNKVKINIKSNDNLNFSEYLIEYKSKSNKVIEKVEKLESLKKIIAEKNNKINKSPKKKIFKKRKYKKKFDMKKN
jgi:ribonuclease E